MFRLFVGVVAILVAPTFAIADPPIEDQNPKPLLGSSGPRFQLFPIPADPKSVWLVDTYTGALSRCEAQSLDATHKCSPWAQVPGESATYRYDPETKKMIPMNDAARRKDAAKQNPN